MQKPKILCAVFVAVAGAALAAGAQAADVVYANCNDYLPAARSVNGLPVGPESCLMLQADIEHDGDEFVRIDMGIDGTAEGYVTMEGTYHEYLTNSPDLIFEQAGTPWERLLAFARYERLRGSAILLAYPKSVDDWNGKLWVSVHGRGRSFRNGSLKIWNRYYEPDDPIGAFDKIDRVMLAKGYAIAVTNRTSEQGIGEVIATLEDGTVIDFAAFNDTASIIKDFTYVAENAIDDRLGRKPARTYLYGHSAGARIGRSINYTLGLNEGPDGEPVFDGFLLDDSATGLWLPIVMRDGKDVLFTTEEERAAFRPQVELPHQMYTKVWERAPDRVPWVTRAYLVNKRRNAQLLVEKGLGDRFRMYEIRSMSHNGGEGLPPDNRRGKALVLDVSLVIGGAIDKVDALAEGSGNVLASKSDWHEIGDVDGDGRIDNPAITYPEVACPLGVFYPYPKNGAGLTAFAAFTGEGVEPLDESGTFVDMNRNGVWDLRETPTEAWRRLGLLAPGEDLSYDSYVECVQEATSKLVDEGFFTAETAARYLAQARVQTLDPALLTE
jgi:hypothetical protein